MVKSVKVMVTQQQGYVRHVTVEWRLESALPFSTCFMHMSDV